SDTTPGFQPRENESSRRCQVDERLLLWIERVQACDGRLPVVRLAKRVLHAFQAAHRLDGMPLADRVLELEGIPQLLDRDPHAVGTFGKANSTSVLYSVPDRFRAGSNMLTQRLLPSKPVACAEA